MTFLSPGRLWLLLGVAALAVAYLMIQRRRSRYAVRFTNLRLLERVAPEQPGWRRHLPAALYLTMLALLVVGFARPTAEARVPRERATVMVAVDVSGSMLASDVQPDRLSAAKTAAREFVDELPATFNVGLVGFAGNASVIVAPSTDRAALVAGIGNLSEADMSAQGTAIGDAILTGMQAIKTLDARAVTDPPPARIVLLSDGANTAGVAPEKAAGAASEAHIPVDTISFGTAGGVVNQDGRPLRVPADSATLRTVADRTKAHFYTAFTGDELRKVYDQVGSSVGYRTERQDVSARFIGFALIIALGAAGASMLWFSRLP